MLFPAAKRVNRGHDKHSLHNLRFFIGQLAGFKENAVGYAELDVVVMTERPLRTGVGSSGSFIMLLF